MSRPIKIAVFPSVVATSLLALAAFPVSAQDYGGRAVVQPLPPPAAADLKQALAQLARDPRSVDALIAAGTASLELDDIDAALGFFGRAAELSPSDPRIKVGRAAAMVRSEQPVEAITLFREAEAAGVPIVRLAGDYGLALDLVGNNGEAQDRYRRALASNPSDETSRRYALSQAISGNAAGFEETLRPLLARRDFAAYRTRAFGLAIMGKADDAVAITEAVMPEAMATKLEPYLRFMPQLTRAQQAAAANLGIYPTAARIGRDDPRIAALAGAPAPSRAPAGAGGALAPAGAPLGTRVAAARETVPAPATAAPALQEAPAGIAVASREEAERAVRVARRDAASDPLSRSRQRPRIVSPPAERTPAPTPPSAAAVQSPVAPPPAAAIPAATPVAVASSTLRAPEQGLGSGELAPIAAPASAAVAAAPPPVQVAAPAAPSSPAPSFDLARLPGQVQSTDVAASAAAAPVAGAAPATVQPVRIPAAVPTPAPVPVPAAPPASEPASVADAFADLSLAAPTPARPAAGAVDITAIRAPREVEKKEEPAAAKAPAAKPPAAKPQPAKPAHPSRFWVQIATGQDRNALKFDWRRFDRQAGTLLDGKGPFVTDWGQTRRLLAGPYASSADARKALNALKEKGIDGFTFTSPSGQEVEALN